VGEGGDGGRWVEVRAELAHAFVGPSLPVLLGWIGTEHLLVRDACSSFKGSV